MTLNPLRIHLWFNNEAEDAAKFYTSIFKNSKIGEYSYYTAGEEVHGQAPGKTMTVDFEINGTKFVGLNGGPMFKFSEAISFQIECDTQEEVDYYWGKLSEGGDPSKQNCGWVADRYGVSWQVVPKRLIQMFKDPDKEKVKRATDLMFTMKRLVLSDLEKAFVGN